MAVQEPGKPLYLEAMVVVSGSWVKNVATYPTPASFNNGMVISNDNQAMAAKAILICRPNSHHFQERTLTLDQPVKVGRSVARAKATATNAIFDCKVLSRHHALLWYENGKFYLQDTKSSNGTFVNNNRLSAETENHELSSGDIVQFGVDVVENNRKVTHGCIIAKLKLYLPDGKEAKASPSITEGDRNGSIPLDELYRLNQIIQEANQREQCLETKLTALQHVVEETRKSAEESWQAYVGEERLLSRVSALENQLQQHSKNWGEDKLREEINKLQDHNEAYQKAAKEALEKLHTERLDAVAAATEHERAKISAEQEALLAKEQLAQTQLELEEVAQKLSEERKKSQEDIARLKQREKELEGQVEFESDRNLDLQIKLKQLDALSITDIASQEELERRGLFYNRRKSKERVLAENELCETDLNKTNGIEQNHINLTVAPVKDDIDENETKDSEEQTTDYDSDVSHSSDSVLQETIEDDTVIKMGTKSVTFKLPEESGDINDELQSQNGSEDTEIDKENNDKSEKDEYNSDHIDSKTLKYQYQSVQNELKKKIELLETVSNNQNQKINDLDKALNEARELNKDRLAENEILKEELGLLQQKLKESSNESQQLKDKINTLTLKLECAEEKLLELNKEKKEETSEKDQNLNKSAISSSLVTYEQLVNVEEELVLLKERFAQVSDDKLKLQRDILSITEQYNIVCNKTYNRYFFYFAPLVFMVLYLLVTQMIS